MSEHESSTEAANVPPCERPEPRHAVGDVVCLPSHPSRPMTVANVGWDLAGRRWTVDAIWFNDAGSPHVMCFREDALVTHGNVVFGGKRSGTNEKAVADQAMVDLLTFYRWITSGTCKAGQPEVETDKEMVRRYVELAGFRPSR